MMERIMYPNGDAWNKEIKVRQKNKRKKYVIRYKINEACP